MLGSGLITVLWAGPLAHGLHAHLYSRLVLRRREAAGAGPDDAGAPLYRRRDGLESDTPHGFYPAKEGREVNEMRTGMTTTQSHKGGGKGRKGSLRLKPYDSLVAEAVGTHVMC